MKAFLQLGVLALACLVVPPSGEPARAQACASFPSSDCPAPGVAPGEPSYPCFPGQIKGDRNSMNYYRPWEQLYPATGAGSRSNTWCFNSDAEAGSFGFSPTG